MGIFAIRVATSLTEVERRQLLPGLLDLASIGHGDLVAVHELTGVFDPVWLRGELPKQIDRLLGGGATDEEYRWLAELLVRTDRGLPGSLVEKARGHESPDVREVGGDFADLVQLD